MWGCQDGLFHCLLQGSRRLAVVALVWSSERRRWVSPAGLLTGLTGDEWRSWALQRHLWRTHIVASPGEKTEQSGNTGGISYCDVISHKTFSFSQMKEEGGRVREKREGEAEGQEWMEEEERWTSEGVEEIQKEGMEMMRRREGEFEREQGN